VTTPERGDVPGSATAVVVRELHWDDFQPLVTTYFELYDERERSGEIGIHLFDERPRPEDEVAWFAGLYQQVLRDEVVVAVAEVDGRAVGSCTIAPAGSRGARSEVSHVGVLGILVNRRYRGRGVGTALMIRALEEARSKFERVRLAVFATNTGAKRLYERLGFRTTGRYPGEVKRGDRYIDEELMDLDLRAWRPPAPHANR
jgi:RimJ/RimL family protein N-acetyltransferase